MNLVTGATGIVGAHLVVELLRKGQQVRIMVRPDSDQSALKALCKSTGLPFDEIDVVHGDILDPLALIGSIKGCKHVYHAAALVSFNPRLRRDLFDANIEGTANVVNACLNQEIESLCYISSTAAIGDQVIDGELTEESAWTTNKGRSEYSLSKRYAEMEALRGRAEGLNTLIVNPGVVIGPGKWGESSTSIIVSCERGMRFYPSGTNGFIDANDIARFCVEGIQNQQFTGRYLLIGENTSFKDLFSTVTTAFGSTPPTVPIPEWLARSGKIALRSLEVIGLNFFNVTSHNIDSAYRRVQYSNKRARALGFEFTPIQNAIERTVEAFKAR